MEDEEDLEIKFGITSKEEIYQHEQEIKLKSDEERESEEMEKTESEDMEKTESDSEFKKQLGLHDQQPYFRSYQTGFNNQNCREEFILDGKINKSITKNEVYELQKNDQNNSNSDSNSFEIVFGFDSS